MNLGELRLYFETSPAVRLLRAESAPYVLAFLHQQFKRSDVIARPHSELLPALAEFQEELQETYVEALRDRPETYLRDWSAGERRWLHRFLEAQRSEPMYQLTPHSEQVIDFLDRALEQELGFVGTESRLRMVIDTLEAVVIAASEDPAVHLEHLRSEKERIERQIARIEKEGSVAARRPAHIREQFATAVSLLKQLQGDFRAVEEKFKEITQLVQQRQVQGLETRGGILADVLDAEDSLKSEDQGVSFYEFFRFIQSPQQQERLRAVIAQLNRIRELAEQTEGLQTVRRMMPLLLAEASKVTQTERRLSTTLRRLLDARAQKERQRVAELLRDIRGLAAATAGDPPRDIVALEIDTGVDIASPFSRTFWTEPQQFEQIDLVTHVVDAEQRRKAFQQFAQMHRLDFPLMRSRIRDAVTVEGHISLRDLLERHPPTAGVIDVVGYLQIASDDGHHISPDADEEIALPRRNGDPRAVAVRVPLVTFIRSSR